MGPALFFGLMLFKYINLPAFMIASVIVDIEPFLILFFGLNYPLHGFFHSFLGGSVAAAALSFAMIKSEGRMQKLASLFKVGQKPSKRSTLMASFSGVFLHVIFDSPLYADIMPFLPASANPLYNPALAGFEVYAFSAMLVAGAVLYFHKALRAP